MAIFAVLGSGLVDRWALREWAAQRALNAAEAQIASGQSAIAALRQAVRERPDLAEARIQLAIQEAPTDIDQALRDAREAVGIDGDSWSGWHALALVEYQAGQGQAAWQSIVHGLPYDRGYAAHYEAASFALVLGHPDIFWAQLRDAMAMAPTAKVPDLVDVALLRAGDDRKPLLSIMPVASPSSLGVAVIELLKRGRPEEAQQSWARLQDCGRQYRAWCGKVAALVSTGLLQTAFLRPAGQSSQREAEEAIQTWNLARSQHWFEAGEARSGWGADPDFLEPWSGPAFAWSTSDNVVPLTVQRQLGGGGAVRIVFTEAEPQQFEIFHQLVVVKPQAAYRISCQASRSGPAAEAGVRVSVSTLDHTLALLGVPLDGQPVTMQFSTPPGVQVVKLAVGYARPMGQMLLHDQVAIEKLAMVPLPVQ